MERIVGRRLEGGVDAGVVTDCFFRFGMDQQGPSPNMVGNRRGLEEDVAQELVSEAAALILHVHA